MIVTEKYANKDTEKMFPIVFFQYDNIFCEDWRDVSYPFLTIAGILPLALRENFFSYTSVMP